MTLSAYAANSSRGTPLAGVEYRPGVCNIGPAEIARRRRAGHVGLLVTVAVLAALVAIDAPPLARLILVLPAAAAASGYLQAWLKFCAGFGSRGMFNFGPVGDTEWVVDEDARARDRARANRIGLASLAIGVPVGVVAALIPFGAEEAAVDANLFLWIGQILLALAFLGVGYGHVLRFGQMSTRPGMTWLAAVGPDRMRIIGILEILGAIGLILPAATGVLLWLTPVAATALAVLMVLAIVLHARRPGEGRNIIGNVILGAIAALIAYGRFVIASL